MESAAAGWYPDPHRVGQSRYWDGSQWTSHDETTAPDQASIQQWNSHVSARSSPDETDESQFAGAEAGIGATPSDKSAGHNGLWQELASYWGAPSTAALITALVCSFFIFWVPATLREAPLPLLFLMPLLAAAVAAVFWLTDRPRPAMIAAGVAIGALPTLAPLFLSRLLSVVGLRVSPQLLSLSVLVLIALAGVFLWRRGQRQVAMIMAALLAGTVAGLLGLFAIIPLLILFSFIPTYVAWRRKSPYLGPIFFLNLFFGWTILVWVAIFIWAYQSTSRPSSSTSASPATPTSAGVRAWPQTSLENSTSALVQLKSMRDQGLITEEQYAAKQAEILGRM